MPIRLEIEDIRDSYIPEGEEYGREESFYQSLNDGPLFTEDVQILSTLDDENLVRILSQPPTLIDMPFSQSMNFIVNSDLGYIQVAKLNELGQKFMVPGSSFFLDHLKSQSSLKPIIWNGRESRNIIQSIAKLALINHIIFKNPADPRLKKHHAIDLSEVDLDTPETATKILQSYFFPEWHPLIVKQDYEPIQFKSYFLDWDEQKDLDPGNKFTREFGVGWKIASPVAKPLIW